MTWFDAWLYAYCVAAVLVCGYAVVLYRTARLARTRGTRCGRR